MCDELDEVNVCGVRGNAVEEIDMRDERRATIYAIIRARW